MTVQPDFFSDASPSRHAQRRSGFSDFSDFRAAPVAVALDEASVEVVAIWPNAGGSDVRALAAIRIAGAIVINGVKIVQQRGKRAYVRLPDAETSRGWRPVLTCESKRLKTRIADAVLAAYSRIAVDGIEPRR